MQDQNMAVTCQNYRQFPVNIHNTLIFTVVLSAEQVLTQDNSEKCVKHTLRECVFFGK